MRRFLLLVFLAACPMRASAMDANSARDAVKDFYNWYSKTNVKSDHYTEQLMSRLHPDLAAACQEENHYAIEDGKRFSADVPYINGDLFWNAQEVPASFEVGNATQIQGMYFVELKLVWKDGSKVMNQRDEVVILKEAEGRPKILNILYGDQDSVIGTLHQSVEYYKGRKSCKVFN